MCHGLVSHHLCPAVAGWYNLLAFPFGPLLLGQGHSLIMTDSSDTVVTRVKPCRATGKDEHATGGACMHVRRAHRMAAACTGHTDAWVLHVEIIARALAGAHWTYLERVRMSHI